VGAVDLLAFAGLALLALDLGATVLAHVRSRRLAGFPSGRADALSVAGHRADRLRGAGHRGSNARRKYFRRDQRDGRIAVRQLRHVTIGLTPLFVGVMFAGAAGGHLGVMWVAIRGLPPLASVLRS